MDNVICKELIVSTIARRGKGIPGSPIRVITQVYDKEGNLIAEKDPMPTTFDEDDLIYFAQFLKFNNVDLSLATKEHVQKYLIEKHSKPVNNGSGQN